MVNQPAAWDTADFADALGPPDDTVLDSVLAQTAPGQNPTPYQPVKQSPQPVSYANLLLPDDVNLRLWEGLKTELPSIPQDESFFRKTWGGLTDLVGKPLDKVGDALTWPSDRLEPVIGLGYWNDVPPPHTPSNLPPLNH